MGIDFEKETWKRTEIEETFNPEAMWKEFKEMPALTQFDFVRQNPDKTIKMLWYLQETFR